MKPLTGRRLVQISCCPLAPLLHPSKTLGKQQPCLGEYCSCAGQTMDILYNKLSNKFIFERFQGHYEPGKLELHGSHHSIWLYIKTYIWGGGTQFQTLAVMKTHFLLGLSVWVGVTLMDVCRFLATIDGAHMLLYLGYYIAHMAGASVRARAVRQLLPCCGVGLWLIVSWT